MKRRDDPRGHGAAKPVGIADGDDPVATRTRVESPKLTNGKIAALDLEQGEVGRRIAADDARRIFLAVGQDDRDAVDRSGAAGALDEMVVGDDIAVGRNDEARSSEPVSRVGGLGVAGDWPWPGGVAPCGASPPPKRRKNSSNGSACWRTATRLLGRVVDHRRLETARQDRRMTSRPARGAIAAERSGRPGRRRPVATEKTFPQAAARQQPHSERTIGDSFDKLIPYPSLGWRDGPCC